MKSLHSIVKKITDEVYKNSNKVREMIPGGSVSTQLSKKEIDFFNKNYTKKSLSQLSKNLTKTIAKKMNSILKNLPPKTNKSVATQNNRKRKTVDCSTRGI